MLRENFPMLRTIINGKTLIYLDNAATLHKPKLVIDKLANFYLKEYAKPNEQHNLSKEATKQMEEAREKMAKFINASSLKEVIFSRGCTESINIIAGGLANTLKAGDEIIVTELEHHSNLIPWQMATHLSGAHIKVAPILLNGELDMDQLIKTISSKTKIIAISHSSHVLGTILPIKEICKIAHEKGIIVAVDGAQAAPHIKVDMQELDCDFYTFSGHKMGSPSGIGVLYGKEKMLDMLPSYEGGADMCDQVNFDNFSYAQLPQKFEAGTRPFAEAIVLGSVIDFISQVGMEKIEEYEKELLDYATSQLQTIPNLTIYGTSDHKAPVISFSIKEKDMTELEKYLNDNHNIAARSGALSAQPLMKVLKVQSLLRVSFAYYNTKEEIDTLVSAIKESFG